MKTASLTPLLRMVERSFIVAGGIFTIYLGYKLFLLGINTIQGSASVFGLVELRNFGPGLFFAAMGAVILFTTMRTAIKVATGTGEQPVIATTPIAEVAHAQAPKPSALPSELFFGIEDTKRIPKAWSEIAFFLETRRLLHRLDNGEPPDNLMDLRNGLKTKLDSITMSAEEYSRHQELIQKLPLDEQEQSELITLEKKLVPDDDYS